MQAMSLDLAKAPKGKKYMYECAFTGKHFAPGSKELLGLGTPPRSPHQPVGTGSTPMRLVLVETKK